MPQHPADARPPPSLARSYAPDRHRRARGGLGDRRRAAATGKSAQGRQTLTYWASNQGASLEADKQILQPELEKFEQQTGIKVKLEVVALVGPAQPDPDRRPPPARAPTSSTSATPGPPRCRPPARCCPSTTPTFTRSAARTGSSPPRSPSTGAAGKDPAAVPLYSPGVRPVLQQEDVRRRRHQPARRPPGTSSSPTARSSPGRRQVRPRRRGREPRREHPPRLRLRPSSTAPTASTAAGKPTFTPRARSRPSSSTSTSWPRTRSSTRATPSTRRTSPSADFANGKAAMLLWQAAGANLKSHGMSAGRRTASRRCPSGRRPGRRAASTRWSPASTWPSSRTPSNQDGA